MSQAPEGFENEEGIRDLLMAQPAVWVPPASQDIAMKLVHLSESFETPYLVYPVPPDWGPEIEVTEARIDELSKMGWKVETDTAALLNDFLKLRSYWDAERTEDVVEEETRAVQAFAQKWGPLWKCHTPGHVKFFEDCYCLPATYGGSYFELSCSWFCQEPVYEFVRTAAVINAVLEAFDLLRRNEPVSIDLWSRLYGHRLTDSQTLHPHTEVLRRAPQAPLQYQRRLLAIITNERLGDLGSPRLWLHWDTNPQPELQLLSGLGFIRSVWTDIVQIMGNAHGWYRCDGCQRWYLRTGRKPQWGRKNYCDKCGIKVARRDWWRENRSKGKRKS